MLRRRNHLRIYDILIRVKRGVLTVGVRNLRPQVLGTCMAAIADVKSNDLAGLGIHSDPYPLLVGFFLHKAGQFIRFNLKALDEHIVLTGDRLDMQMVRQGCKALDEKAYKPLEGDTDRTTHTPQREPFEQQAFDEPTLVLRDEVLLAALDKLASTVVAVMILFAVVNVAIFLKLGGLTLWTDVSDDHGVLLTSAEWDAFLVNQSTASSA